MRINNCLNINNDCQAAIQDNKIANSVYFIENCKIIKSSKGLICLVLKPADKSTKTVLL